MSALVSTYRVSPSVRPATACGTESLGSPVKAPEAAKAAKECWSLMRFQRPELRRWERFWFAFLRAELRVPIWMISDYVGVSMAV